MSPEEIHAATLIGALKQALRNALPRPQAEAEIAECEAIAEDEAARARSDARWREDRQTLSNAGRSR
jgi:hypothetical protein